MFQRVRTHTQTHKCTQVHQMSSKYEVNKVTKKKTTTHRRQHLTLQKHKLYFFVLLCLTPPLINLSMFIAHRLRYHALHHSNGRVDGESCAGGQFSPNISINLRLLSYEMNSHQWLPASTHYRCQVRLFIVPPTSRGLKIVKSPRHDAGLVLSFQKSPRLPI